MPLLRETIPVGSGIIKVASPGCIKEPWASSCMMVYIQKGEMMVNGLHMANTAMNLGDL